MPKLKTCKGAAKRFKKTANGVKRKRAFRNHILTKKTTKRLRHLRGMVHVKACDVDRALRQLKEK